jgi:hypothetical protein
VAGDDLLGEILRQPLDDPERPPRTGIILMIGALVVALAAATLWWLSRPKEPSSAGTSTTSSASTVAATPSVAVTGSYAAGESTTPTTTGIPAPPADAFLLDLIAIDTGELLLFGGATADLAADGAENWLNDLSWLADSLHGFDGVWRFDPLAAEWSLESIADVAPTPRFGAAIAFHPPTGRIVLFGGGPPEFRSCYGVRHCPGTETAEVWQYDPAGNEWKEMTPPEGSQVAWPSPRFGHRFAYEPITERLITFGGATTTGESAGQFGPEYSVTLGADTWAYDPATNTWEDLGTADDATGPPAVISYGLTWSTRAGRVVLFGGDGEGSGLGSDPSELYALDPATGEWASLGGGDGTLGPGERWLHTLAEDPRTGMVVSIGGVGSVIEVITGGTTRGSGPIQDMWAWEPDGGWTPLQSAPGPILTSAVTANGVTGDLIVWDGTTLWRYDTTTDMWYALWERPTD